MSNERKQNIIDDSIRHGYWLCSCGFLNQPWRTICGEQHCHKARPAALRNTQGNGPAIAKSESCGRRLAAPLSVGTKYKNEKELQSACESVLLKAGFRRMTEANLVHDAGNNVAGWFAHFPRAVGNPLMPDLIAWNREQTRTLMVELKFRSKFSRAQKSACTYKLWRLAWSADEFAGLLAEWIGGT